MRADGQSALRTLGGFESRALPGTTFFKDTPPVDRKFRARTTGKLTGAVTLDTPIHNPITHSVEPRNRVRTGIVAMQVGVTKAD